ncbi:MAG TPA: pentapeptide repeat-containing protein, partial [Alphaproteobacteria bacterium]|nr:pentapeptide repeat-containing protein [Alphaproteobacteria bacterium]
MSGARVTYRFLCLGLSLFTLVVLATTAAHAKCADPAAPGVDWRRCYMEGLPLAEATLPGAQLREARFNRADLARA